jgi:hypothetical protein
MGYGEQPLHFWVSWRTWALRGTSGTVTNPSGKYAIVMYVSILILFPCLIVVLLSRSAVWLSSTFVTVEIWVRDQRL